MGNKLPIRDSIFEILDFLQDNWADILRKGWPALALIALAQLITGYSQIQRGADASASGAAGNFFVLIVAQFLIGGLGVVPMITGVHRRVLIGEEGLRSFTFQKEEIRYWLTGLKLSFLLVFMLIILGIVGLVLGLVLGSSRLVTGDGPSLAALILGSTLCYLFVFWFVGTSTLTLPAAAIGRTLAMRESREILSGHKLAFLAVFSALMVPLFVVQIIPSIPMFIEWFAKGSTAFLTQMNEVSAWSVVAQLFGVVFRFVDLVVIASCLSVVYRRLSADVSLA
jgi:hypothetical protein